MDQCQNLPKHFAKMNTKSNWLDGKCERWISHSQFENWISALQCYLLFHVFHVFSKISLLCTAKFLPTPWQRPSWYPYPYINRNKQKSNLLTEKNDLLHFLLNLQCQVYYIAAQHRPPHHTSLLSHFNMVMSHCHTVTLSDLCLALLTCRICWYNFTILSFRNMVCSGSVPTG